MQQRTARVLIASLCVLAFVVAFVPVAAQDDDPAPGAIPTPGDSPDSPPGDVLTSTHTTRAIALPFAETFDGSTPSADESAWQASGAWVYGQAAGYMGGGWFFDVNRPRGATNTLEYTLPIDLYGELSARLTLRQKANLRPGDLVAVDVSLNGGTTWMMIDHQSDLATDWEQHVVDLSDYRGHVIQLRFRINMQQRRPGETPTPTASPIPTADAMSTPPASDASTPASTSGSTPPTVPTAVIPPPGYWIDNLTIQYFLEVEPPPDIEYAAGPSGPHTEMGLHLVISASDEAVITFAKRMHDIGWPLGTIKGTTGTEKILARIAEVSPETVIVYRSLETPWGMQDCPNQYNDPVAEARKWMDGIRQYWTVEADFYEIMNECHPPTDWLVPFTIEAMRIAAESGQCILAFSFGPGNPEPDYYARLVPIYEYALANPCQPGRYHGVALHAYGIGETTLVSESGPYLGLRHRLYYRDLLESNPEFARLPVYLTEAGPGDGRVSFECTEVTRDVIQYTSQLEHDPYVRGFHLWNIGYISGWMDVTNCLPMIGDALINYYAGRS